MFVPVEQLVGKSVGQYRLTKLIGKSDLSAVYEAVPSGQTGTVMFTFFPLPDDCVGEAWELFMERFEEDMSSLLRLQHPHVVPYYEYGEEFGYPYLITPFVATTTLADVLKQEICTPAQMLYLLKQIASGLDYIHSQGVAHGALKPSNILLYEEQDGQRVMIANVGLTHILRMQGIGQVSHSHPHLFSVAGTLLTNPAYLAPEVVQGADDDARSDMYALGILIYEMLCGRPPFIGSDPMEIALQHVNQRVPPLQTIRPDLPVSLEFPLQGALVRDPARRLQSAEMLASSFERVVAVLEEAGTANVAPAPQREVGTRAQGSSAAEGLWQGMPGVTANKMASLVPEFISGSGSGRKPSRGSGTQFKAFGSAPLLPQKKQGAAPVPALSLPAQQQQLLKPPLAPVKSALPGRVVPPAPVAPQSPVQRPTQMPPAQPPLPQSAAAPMPPSTQLVTVVAAGKPATQMLSNAQSAPVQGGIAPAMPPVMPPAMPNAYGAQMPVAPAQMPPANYAGWYQQGNANMYAPPDAAMQSGTMYSGDPRYAQQQYMDGYGQGVWLQQEEPEPASLGRRRAMAMLAGAAVAAVLGAGGITVMRTLQARENQDNARMNTNNIAQTPAAGQQVRTNSNPAPATQKIQTIIAKQNNLAKNAALDFTNPIDKHTAILVHLPNGNFVAYDKACTHQAVPLQYDPKTNKLVCPLHKSIFDPANNGAIVQGPAFLRLPKVEIHVNADGTITAGT